MAGIKKISGIRGIMRPAAAALLLLMLSLCLPCLSLAEKEGASIRVILSNNCQPYNQALKGIRKGLEEKHPKLSISTGSLENSSSIAIARKLRETRPDIAVTIGTRATLATLEMNMDIPIVFSMVLDPPETLLKSDSATGVLLDIPAARQLAWLKKITPRSRRIGILYTVNSEKWIHRARRAAVSMGLEIIPLKVDDPSQLPDMLDILEQRADVLWAVPDGAIYNTVISPQLILFCLQHKIPFMGLSSNFTRAGALLSLDCDYETVGEQTAAIISTILAGHSPSEIPPQSPHKIIPSINIRTARILGLKIPDAILENARIFAD